MIKTFTVIVPSYNRVDEIEALLPTLEVQTLSKSIFDLIIVDDGSTDETVEFIVEYKKSSLLSIQVIQQKNQGPGAARNNGMAHAKGDFFVFIDSDVILPNHWAQTLFDEINEHEYTAFGGADRAHKSFSATLKAIDYAMTSFITTGGLKEKTGKKLAKFFPRSFNMGLHKDVYEEIGGFGGLRHGQDIEFSNRIIQSGAKLGFIEDAYVFHKRRTNLKKFFKQVFNWGVARINLFKIDKNMLEPLHCMPAVATFMFLFILALTPVSEINYYLTLTMLFSMGAVFFLSAIHAGVKYKNFTTPFLVPFTMFTQIFAYGLGFIWAFIRRVVFSSDEFKGFSKNYYK